MFRIEEEENENSVRLFESYFIYNNVSVLTIENGSFLIGCLEHQKTVFLFFASIHAHLASLKFQI